MHVNVPSAIPLDTELQQAIAEHQAGRYLEAEEIYLSILQAQPYHAIANHNLGMLAGQVGQHAAGLPYLRKALSINPDEGQFWLSYANGLLQAGQPGEALDIVDTAIGRGLDNDASQALLQQAQAAVAQAALGPSQQETNDIVSLFQAGEYEKMEVACRQLLENYPDSQFGWSVLGTCLQVQGKDALAVLQKTLSLTPHDAEAHGNLGNAWQTLGRFDDAIDCYLRALELDPTYAEAECNLGSVLQAQGRLNDAEAAYRRALALNSSYTTAHFNLGNTLKAQGKYEAAADSYRDALTELPDDPEIHCNLGNALQACKQLDAAVLSYRRALALQPGYIIAMRNLGAVLLDLGQRAAALETYQYALALAPNDPEVNNGLGNALRVLGRLEEAEAMLERTIRYTPSYAPAHTSLGRTLFQLGKYGPAVESYRVALALQPEDVDAYNLLALSLAANEQSDEAYALHLKSIELAPDKASTYSNFGDSLKFGRRLDEAILQYEKALSYAPTDHDILNKLGMALQANGQLNEALSMYQKALDLNPVCAIAYCNMGSVKQAQLKYAEAKLDYIRALELEPEFAGAHFNLGTCMMLLNAPKESLQHYRRALKIKPDYREAHINIAATLSGQGQMTEALDACRAALSINSDWSAIHSNYLFLLSHSGSQDSASLYAEHVRFGDQFEAPQRNTWPAHANLRDVHRCLKIGFVSADFNNHAVAHFFTPVLEELARSTCISLYAYYNNNIDDYVTERLRQFMPQWRNINELPDKEVGQMIEQDGIDILIDLSGHTGKNRLPLFARKPAPIQASWIGYPGTTGLQAIDYYIADRHLLPPGKFDNQFTEKLAYLPASAPFLPSAEAPDVNALPALANGYITFGSFNRINKLNPEVIAVWSQLLHAVPNARMLLGAMQDDTDNADLVNWFSQNDIGRERLSFHGRTGMEGYLKLHHRVDICLDTFPYTGGTTTLHGLWMGVPMLTLAGDSMPGRTSAAILGHLQLDAFVATSTDEFVEKGVFIANNLELLASLRTAMRQLLCRSPLGQPPIIAAGLEGALRNMWQRWCVNDPVESFEIEIDDTNDKLTVAQGENHEV